MVHIRTSFRSSHDAHSLVALADESTDARFLITSNDLLARHYVVDPVPEGFGFQTGKIQLYGMATNKTWSKVEDLLGTGKVGAIGISNFSIKT